VAHIKCSFTHFIRRLMVRNLDRDGARISIIAWHRLQHMRKSCHGEFFNGGRGSYAALFEGVVEKRMG